MQQWDYLPTDDQARINRALRVPFPPAEIEWLPIAPKDNSARAAPYADVRAYQDRLDGVCGKNWSVMVRPASASAGNLALIVSVTIFGRCLADVGEAPAKDENAYTVALAQGFKRACSAHGCGRSFYRFPRVYGEYVAGAKRFTDKAIDRLNGIYDRWYTKVIADLPPLDLPDDLEPGTNPPQQQTTAPATQPAATAPTQPATQAPPPPQPPKPAPTGPISDGTKLGIYAAAKAVFGETDWTDALNWYCAAFTRANLARGEQANPDMLDEAEGQALLDALTRNSAKLPDYWQGYKTTKAKQAARPPQPQTQPARPQPPRRQS